MKEEVEQIAPSEIKKKKHETDNTIHVKCKLLYVSAPRCHLQGVLKEQVIKSATCTYREDVFGDP